MAASCLRSRLLVCFMLVSCGAAPDNRASGSDSHPKADVVATAKGLCQAEESVIFQCKVEKSSLAVCGGHSADGEPYVRYAFGAPGSETKVSSREVDGTGAFSWANAGYSGGGEQQIRFVHNGNEYVTYSRVVRTSFGEDGRNNPQDEAGVIVRRGSKILLNKSCNDPWNAVRNTADPSDFMPEGKMVDLEP